MNYKILVEGGTWVEVAGRPVKIKGFKFFYWKDDNGRFVITEVATGRRVCSARTLTKARECATEKITALSKKNHRGII